MKGFVEDEKEEEMVGDWDRVSTFLGNVLWE